MSAGQHPCPACGGETAWDPRQQQRVCSYCGTALRTHEEASAQKSTVASPFEELDLASALSKSVGRTPVTENERRVECKQCNAITVWSGERRAGRCDFCGAPTVVELEPVSEDEGGIAPSGVVPFALDERQAKGKVREWLGKLWFRPSDLKKLASLNRMSGIYLPFYSFDADGRAHYSAERGDHYYVTETYTENGERKTRQVQKTRWTPVSGQVQRLFDDLLVCASQGAEREKIRKISNWPLANLLPWNRDVLAGFVAEDATLPLAEGWQIARGRMDDTLRSDCISDIGGDTHRNLHMQSNYGDRSYRHSLLPAWLGTYRYRHKTFQVWVNGTTGSVAGEAPLSWAKVAGAVLAAAALGAGIWYLVQMSQ